MKRREFLGATGAASAACMIGANSSNAQDENQLSTFHLQYAPHFGMFKQSAGNDLVDQLKFAADHGFTAWEDNGMKNRSVEDQNRVAKAMSDLKMEMGVFVAYANFVEPVFGVKNQAKWDEVLTEIKASVEVAKRVNANGPKPESMIGSCSD